MFVYVLYAKFRQHSSTMLYQLVQLDHGLSCTCKFMCYECMHKPSGAWKLGCALEHTVACLSLPLDCRASAYACGQHRMHQQSMCEWQWCVQVPPSARGSISGQRTVQKLCVHMATHACKQPSPYCAYCVGQCMRTMDQHIHWWLHADIHGHIDTHTVVPSVHICTNVCELHHSE